MERVRDVFTRIGNVGIGKESPKLGALLNLGFVPAAEENLESQEKILSALPKTREFLASLPHHAVEEMEEENARKATEAMRLANKVETLISGQERAVEDFKHQLTQLNEMTRNLQEAEKLASSLHKQLLDLTRHVSSMESRSSKETLEELRRREKETLAIYKEEKRQKVEIMRQEYAQKLDDFHRERLGILVKELGEGTIRPHSSASMKRRSAAAKLESVNIEHNEGIEDFFEAPNERATPPPRRPGTASATVKSSTPAATPTKKQSSRRAVILADEDFEDDMEEFYKKPSKSKGKNKAT